MRALECDEAWFAERISPWNQSLEGTGHLSFSGGVFTSDNAFFAAIDESTVLVWETATGKLMNTLRYIAQVGRIAFVPRHQGQLLVAFKNGEVVIEDALTGSRKVAFQVGHAIQPYHKGTRFMLSPDGTKVVIKTPAGHVQIWDVERPCKMTHLELPGRSGQMQFARDSASFAMTWYATETSNEPFWIYTIALNRQNSSCP
jgi:WD40 repeat protein